MKSKRSADVFIGPTAAESSDPIELPPKDYKDSVVNLTPAKIPATA